MSSPDSHDSPILGNGGGKRRVATSSTLETQEQSLGLGLDVNTPALTYASSPKSTSSPAVQSIVTPRSSMANFRQCQLSNLAREEQLGLGIDSELETEACAHRPEKTSSLLEGTSSSMMIAPLSMESRNDLSRNPNVIEKNKKRGSLFNLSNLSFGNRKRQPDELTSIHERQPSLESASSSAETLQASPMRKASSRKLSRSGSTASSKRPTIDLFPPLPLIFPCQRDQAFTYQERSEFLMKHQPLSFGLINKHGTFRPRLIMLCKYGTEATQCQYSLNCFKSNQPKDYEVERMQLSKNSIACVTSEIPGGRLFVLKVTGRVSAMYNPPSDKEEAWFFSMSDQAHLSDWLGLLKGVIAQLKNAAPSLTSTPIRATPSRTSISSQSPVSTRSALGHATSQVLEARSRSEPIHVAHPFAASFSNEVIDYPRSMTSSPQVASFPHRTRGLSNESTFLPLPINRASLSSRYSTESAANDDFEVERESAMARRMSSDLIASMNSRIRRNSLIYSGSPIALPPTTPAPSSALPPLPPQAARSHSPTLADSHLKRQSMHSYSSEISTPSASENSSTSSLFSKPNRVSSSSEMSDAAAAQNKFLPNIPPPEIPPRSPLRAKKIASIESITSDSTDTVYASMPLPPIPYPKTPPLNGNSRQLYEVQE